MESKAWVTTKIQRPIYNKIVSAVESLEVMDVKKYNSVPEFIQEACIELLEKESKNG